VKTAQTANGKKVEAKEGAPKSAVCSFCGGPVCLRRRKLMNEDGVAYFWRHEPGADPTCPARSRPARRSSRTGKTDAK
jgi:hypothetical protein